MYEIYHYVDACVNITPSKTAIYRKIDIVARLAYWNTEFSKLLSARVKKCAFVADYCLYTWLDWHAKCGENCVCVCEWVSDNICSSITRTVKQDTMYERPNVERVQCMWV